MKQQVTPGIVLQRTAYGEADRIITVLTPEQGKLRLMARGVRKIKSKLAGGIELFSVSDLTYVTGRGEIGTLTSARMRQHYGRITTSLDRVQFGYELLRIMRKATEDHPEAGYFELLEQALAALDDHSVESDLIHLWFEAQLLRLGGHSPNLQSDPSGQPLPPANRYLFDLEAMGFRPKDGGKYGEDHIKMLRLVFGRHTPKQLSKVDGAAALTTELRPLVGTMFSAHLQI